jgi:hypothetical protein
VKQSASVILWPPGVATFGLDPAAQPNPSWDAADMPYLLWCQYIWTADCCGNPLHLDKVTLREYVTYEQAYTDQQTHKHDLSHAGASAFASNWDDPTRTFKPGNLPPVEDRHFRPQIAGDIDESQCHGVQQVQWATAWPEPPAYTEDELPWETVATYDIHRAIVSHDGKWWYQISKHGVTYERELP